VGQSKRISINASIKGLVFLIRHDVNTCHRYPRGSTSLWVIAGLGYADVCSDGRTVPSGLLSRTADVGGGDS